MTELSDDARRLIARTSALGGPSRAQRSTMKRAVVAAIAVPAAAASATSVAASAGASSLVTTVVVAALSVSVGAGVTLGINRSVTSRRAVVVAAPVLAPAPVPVAPIPVEAAPAVEPPEVVEPPASEAPVAAPRLIAPRPRAAPVEVVAPTPDVPREEIEVSKAEARAEAERRLAREVSMLSTAMRAVDERRFGDALSRLEQYREQFPAGTLADEGRVIEVLALCGEARVDEARALAAGLRRSSNPSVRRLQRSCVTEGRFGAVQGDDK